MWTRLRVLLAEKRFTEGGIILRSICAGPGWALEVAYARAKDELGSALEVQNPDVALLDLSLPQPDAPTEVRVLNRKNNNVPLILFAEPADTACAVECLSVGATDFLLEGFMDERTVARVLQSVVRRVGEARSMAVESQSNRRKRLRVEHESEPVEESKLCVGAGATTERLPHELMRLLKRNIRASDRVVPRRCGQVDLVLGNANERALDTIIRRLRARVSVYEGSFSGEVTARVTVWVSVGGGSAQPLKPGMRGCAKGDNDCAAEQLMIKGRP
jgi:DNA-binding response OmpR family regulator